MRLVVILLIFVLLFCEALGNEDTIIKIKNGKIRGVQMTSEKGNNFYSFRGIPYAEPPVGDLRFMPPVDIKPWGNKIFDATEDGPICPQMDFLHHTFIGQEDNCLVLNVYTPQLPNEEQFEPRAVMVFIHGGAFKFGTVSSLFYNPKSLIDNDIVLVTMNYRLGPLGFLSSGDEAAPGNYGLLDQNKALQWVKENIEEFGGDTERITIFGESAGGASVTYQIISAMSKDLFHRAIAMSGSSICIWAFQDNPLKQAQNLGIKLPCSIDDNEQLIECLRKAPAKEIIQHGFVFNRGFLPFVFAPTLDNHFLKDTPINLLSSGKFNKDIGFMSGITKDEGAIFYAAFNPNASVLTKKDFKKGLADMIGVSIDTKNPVKLIEKRYLQGVDISNEKEMRKILTEIYSHGCFDKCLFKTSKLVSKLGIETFAYQYDYTAPFSASQLFGINEVFGVSHFDDMLMIFDGLFAPVNMTEKDKKMKSTFQTLLSNFGKYGHPTHKLSEANLPQWHPVKNDKMTIYHIDDPIRTDIYNSDEDDLYEFWTHDIPEVLMLSFTEDKDEF